MKVLYLLFSLALTTTLLHAMEPATERIFNAVKNDEVAIVRSLLEQNSTLVHQHDIDGYTLLHWASCCGDKYPMVALPDRYCSHRIKVSYPDYQRRCFLNDTPQTHAEIVRVLFKHGASANSQNNIGQTPLHIAATETIRCLLLANGASINQQDNCGDTPLHKAVSAGYIDFVHFLLEHGASNLKNSEDATPIDLGKSEGFHVIADMIQQCLQIRQQRLRAAKLTFCEVLHPRLGASSPANVFPQNVVQEILQHLRPEDFAIINHQAT